jgi:DNA-binding response OmpR family regulator
MIKVGLVEDNKDFRSEISDCLKRNSFEVGFETDGHDIDALLETKDCNVLLLDLGLPTEDGLSIAKRTRENYPHIGLVMLTARNSLDDRLDGLRHGSDAYLSKPANLRELIAVIQNVHRRLNEMKSPETSSCGWKLEFESLKLTSPNNKFINLTFNELKLIELLALAKSSPVSRKDLASVIGYKNLDFDDRILEVAFSRLRQKIDSIYPDNNLIRAARSQGYLLAAHIELNK